MAKTLSVQTFEKDVVKEDKKRCRRFGPCGVGEKALYLNSFYFDRIYYIPFSAVQRVFKRVAMSKGGFTGKGIFATLPYLVVKFDDGKERQFLFKREEHVDAMLAYIAEKHPLMPLVSEAVEKKIAQRKAEEAAKPKKVITQEAEEEARKLEEFRQFLERRPALAVSLSNSAKAKRVNERSNPTYRWVALAIVLLGIAVSTYGVYALVTHAEFGLYFMLFGLAAAFLFAGANVLPTKRNNKKYIDQQWKDACDAVERHMKTYSGMLSFEMPSCYAHPVTVTRMIRVIREDRAKTAAEALEVVKADLKALNSEVKVDQEEFDEIMAIKPMFLVENYR